MAESIIDPSQALPPLLELYHLSEQNCKKQVTDQHLEEISSSCCSKWKSLRPHMEMEEIVEHDIDASPVGGPEGKRRAFFFKWKNMKGSGATYRVLITALLKIRCREDAESVCKLLAQTLGLHTADTGEHSYNMVHYCSKQICQGFFPPPPPPPPPPPQGRSKRSGSKPDHFYRQTMPS